VICSAGSGLRPSFRLDVRPEPPLAGGERPPRVQIHHGTRRAAARVVHLDEEGLAQLRLESPLIAGAGDRFVVRSISPVGTLGGGVVIDPTPARHGPGASADRLRVVSQGSPEELIGLALQDSVGEAAAVPADPDRWASHPILGPSRERFAPARWREAIAELLDSGRAVERGGSLALAESESAATEPAEVPKPDELALRVLDLLRGDGVSPRSPTVLAEAVDRPLPQVQAALDALAASGGATRVKPDIYYDAETLEELRSRLLALAAERGGAITLAEARNELGTSRKYAQALVEHLDALHLTVRHGDRHVLRRSRREEVMPS
jgi:selenocysteine-specific elongation factor